MGNTLGKTLEESVIGKYFRKGPYVYRVDGLVVNQQPLESTDPTPMHLNITYVNPETLTPVRDQDIDWDIPNILFPQDRTYNPDSDVEYDPYSEDIVDKSILAFDFLKPVARNLLRMGVRTPQDLLDMTDQELLRCKRFGSKSLIRVQHFLTEHGYSLKEFDREAYY
jgi:hypothetical protein